MRHTKHMHPERLAFLHAINAHPRERTTQLVFADWLDEHGEDRKASYWRCRSNYFGLGGRGCLVGRGGRGGLVGRGGRGGLVGLGGLVGRGGRGGLGGLGGLVGRGGRGGRGGLVGRGGRGGPFHPENQIVLIQGENVMVFIPNGYGFSVVVGHVAQELPHGWIVDPCRDILDTNNGDCWVELAAGKNKQMRTAAKYGTPIYGGMRVPFGCISIPWNGDLPK